MTLQSSGAISLSQIAGEFGGKNPLELGEYRGQDNAPTTGAISFSNFYGTDGIPTSGLQYHYDGQISEHNDPSAGNVQDLGSSNYTGTLTNGAAYNTGNFGKVVFDGVDDYVNLSGYNGVTGTTARTSIVFFKLDASPPSAVQRLLTWGDPTSGTGKKWAMEINTSGQFNLGIGGAYRLATKQLTTNTWNMIAATWPGSAGGGGGSPTGQQNFTSSGTFTVPAGVTSIAVVVVGGGGGGGGSEDSDETGGGGGGGALAYVNNLSVTAGESLTVTVGSGGNGGNGDSGGSSGGFSRLARGGTTLAQANGGGGGQHRGSGGSGGTVSTGTGGSGGQGGQGSNRNGSNSGGGGGAGGYSGAGGRGCDQDGSPSGASGSGGAGGGGGRNDGGGGVGILGQGSSGSGGGTSNPGGGGSTAGSGGTNGSSGSGDGGNGGLYGGGGGGAQGSNNDGGDGRPGAVRIIWGSGRSFPSTLTTDQTSSSATNDLEDITLYHNAQKLTNYSDVAGAIDTTTGTNVAIGRANAGAAGNVDGEVAKALIYNRELTHAEVAQIYNAKCVALGLSQETASTETTSSPPTYSITQTATTIYETSGAGSPQSTTFTITTTNVANGTTLYWTCGGGNVSSADFTQNTTSGSFTINNNTGSVTLTARNDGVADDKETFTLEVRTGSTSGTVVATSSTITINE